jgi:hypothetical protein
MPLPPKNNPTLFPKIAQSSKTLTPKQARCSSHTKHEYSIADLFIRKLRHVSPAHAHPNVDVEQGLLAEEDADDARVGKEKSGRMVYITIGVFATLGIGAWIVSVTIATGVVGV